jgi:hypothetical protein
VRHRTDPRVAAAARAAEGAVGGLSLPQTDQKKASMMPRAVAESARTDLWAAAVRAEGAVAFVE